MGAVEAGNRVKIIEFGPKDSWAIATANGDPSPLGMTGYIVEIQDPVFCSPGYIRCMIHLDAPFMNYLVRMSFYEVKVEKLDE